MQRRASIEKKFPIPKDENGFWLHVCAVCGKDLSNDKRNKYCSKECRQKAYIESNPHIRFNTIPMLNRNCYLCGIELTPTGPRGGCKWWLSKAVIHHITPLGEGGLNKIENLVGLCKECHIKIHTARRFYQKIYDFILNDWPKKKKQKQIEIKL